MIEYGINTVGEDAQIFEPVTLGFPRGTRCKKPVYRDFNRKKFGDPRRDAEG